MNTDLEAFRRRAMREGDFSTYARVEAMRQQQRQAQFDRLFWWRPTTVGGVVFYAMFGIVACLVTLALVDPFLLTCIIGLVVCTMVGVSMYRRKSRKIASLPPSRSAVVDPASTLPSLEAAAVYGALPAARRKQYHEALTTRLLSPPTTVRHDDAGDVVTVPLPIGCVSADIDLERFAAAMQVRRTQISLDVQSPPRAALIHVLHADPASIAVPEWPALRMATCWSNDAPLGVDERGKNYHENIAGRRMLVAGQSGSGKTRFMRMVALYALADVKTTLHIIDLKGSPALRDLGMAADTYHAGPATPALVARLESIRDDMMRRYDDMLAGVDVIERDGWTVIVIDEAQALWSTKGAEEAVEIIARMGREAGVGLVIGSQTPDKAAIPRAIVDQCDVRVAMRLTAEWATGIVLGDYTVDATSLPPGHAYVHNGHRVQRLATFHVTDEQAAQVIVEHDRRRREARPTPLRLVRDVADAALLGDVLAVIGERSGASWDEIGAGLDRDVEGVKADLRSRGVTSKTVRSTGGSSARGVRRVDVEAAVTRGATAPTHPQHRGDR